MLRTLTRFAITAALSLTLTACFHTQLKGSVGGGSLTIAPLRSPDNILATATPMTPADLKQLWGQQLWEDKKPLVRLIFVGIAKPGLDELDSDALYLVTANGGQDFDPNLELSLSNSPVDVQGKWHAIVSGQRIMDGNIQVSALTEALYQQQKTHLNQRSDEQVKIRLNAAAKLLVEDLDESGSVDYDDVLRWIRTLDGSSFLGNLAAVDALSDAIISGQPGSMLTDNAKEVLGNHRVALEFDVGTVTVRTLNWESPVTAANFLTYVNDGFYDDMLVHRAIDGFMIQLGFVETLGLDDNGTIQWAVKTPGAPIINESSNGLSNIRGTLSMARTSDPNSASSQFFINQVDNSFLDYGTNSNPDGYAVFARVLSGMTVVDEVAAEPTAYVRGIGADVPTRGVVLNSAKQL